MCLFSFGADLTHKYDFVVIEEVNSVTFHPLLSSREGDKLVPSVQKKINELEVGLLHLQQNIDIPEITLTIHAAIQVPTSCQGGGLYCYP